MSPQSTLVYCSSEGISRRTNSWFRRGEVDGKVSVRPLWRVLGTVKWGESGLAGRVGTKFRSSKTDSPAMSRLFDFWKHSGEASKTSSAPRKTRPCSRFSVFKVLNFVPTRPASPNSPHFTVLYLLGTFLHLKPLLRYRFSNYLKKHRPPLIVKYSPDGAVKGRLSIPS